MDANTAAQSLKQTFLRGAIAGLGIGVLVGAMVGWKLGQPEALSLVERAEACQQT